ncbi:hypothetical protein [Microcoleus asticus]|uniref:hypothetical protein n=1 Tax=Microcoleus asticus TaxID=2815231 RepID=UPI001C1316FB|nr:hypothetical protein [Microcoleus asticus]
MSAYLSQRFFLTAGDRPEVSQPTSNCQILLYRRSTYRRSSDGKTQTNKFFNPL